MVLPLKSLNVKNNGMKKKSKVEEKKLVSLKQANNYLTLTPVTT